MTTHSYTKIVQHNLTRSMASADELAVCFRRNRVDVALVQEPYTRQVKLVSLEDLGIRVIKTKSNDMFGNWAAIIVFNPEMSIMQKPHLTNEHIVVANVGLPGQESYDVMSGHFQIRKETKTFIKYIRNMSESDIRIRR